MFNNEFEVDIKIKGKFKNDYDSYESYIKNVHISEDVVNGYAQIKIIPIVGRRKSLGNTSPEIPFELNFTHKLSSFKPSSNNKYLIICGEKEATINVLQSK